MVLYCQVAPTSTPVTFTVPMLVMPSLPLAPLSVASASAGAAGATVSRVKPPTVLATLVLPAASVTVVDTETAPWPSVVRLAVVRVTACTAPLPDKVLVTDPEVPVNTAVTVDPLSALTDSTPVTAVASALVRLPSPAAPKPGVGAVVSTTSADAMLAAGLMLPAASLCRTCTAPAAKLPCGRLKLVPLPLFQVLPPLLLYCQVAPPSMPVTLTVPTLVMPSLALLPLSVASVGTSPDGSTVSRVNAPTLLLTALPPASLTVVDTVTAPWPSATRLAALSVTACAAPVPVTDFVTVPAVPVNTTLTTMPVSAVTRITPLTEVASAAVRLPSPTGVTDRVGATVSSVKPPTLLVAVLPAMSLTVVATVTAPSPRPVTSPAVSAIVCADPVPVSALITLPPVPVNSTLTTDPLSALTLSTPPAAVASACVLALSPTALTASVGATVSRMKLPVPLNRVFPAVSLAVVATPTGPWPRVARSPALSATVCGAPLPVSVLDMLPAVPVKTTLTAAPVSALTVTTPPPAVASASVLAESPTAATLSVGAVLSSV